MSTSKAILHNHGYSLAPSYDIDLSLRKEWDPSITDPTFYTPVGSLVRKLNAQDKIPMTRDPQFYDFPDGRDTGIELPVSRKLGVDLAEITVESRSLAKSAEKGINDAKQRKADKLAAEKAARLAAEADSSVSSDSN